MKTVQLHSIVVIDIIGMLKPDTLCVGFHPRYRGNYRPDGYRNGETGYNCSWRGPKRGLLTLLLLVVHLFAFIQFLLLVVDLGGSFNIKKNIQPTVDILFQLSRHEVILGWNINILLLLRYIVVEEIYGDKWQNNHLFNCLDPN